VAFPGQPIWKFHGNWFVETHIYGKAQAKETEFVDVSISFVVLL
jgi:hypothetical protein